MTTPTVTTAIIPAAGWGTRMLPFTRAVPKELLPVYDRTVIDWALDEAIQCGISRVILVSSEHKPALKEHIVFTQSDSAKAALGNEKFNALIEPMNERYRQLDIQFVYQQEQLGLGHAIYCAHEYIQDESFAVILPDEVMLPPRGENPVPDLAQMIAKHQQTGRSEVLVTLVEDWEVESKGIVELENEDPNCTKVKEMREKPSLSTTNSRLAIVGRYVCPASIMHSLKSVTKGVGGEIQFTDALQASIESSGVNAHKVSGLRIDVGDHPSWRVAHQLAANYLTS